MNLRDIERHLTKVFVCFD